MSSNSVCNHTRDYTNRTPATRSSDQSYDYRPNWTPLSPVTITNIIIIIIIIIIAINIPTGPFNKFILTSFLYLVRWLKAQIYTEETKAPNFAWL